MKSRYLEQEKQLAIMRHAAEDMAQQFMAAACYAIHIKHLEHSDEYRKKKVKEIFEDINAVLTVPDICGKSLQGCELINFISKKYGINFDGIKFKVETDEECRRRKTK